MNNASKTILTATLAALALPACTAPAPEQPAHEGSPLLSLDPGAPTGKTWRCDIDEVPDFIDPAKLSKLLGIVAELSDDDEDELDRVCAEIKETIIDPIRHSTGEDYPPDIEKKWAQLVLRYWRRYEVKSDPLPEDDQGFRASQSRIESAYPCGDGPNGRTLCASGGLFPEGEVVMVAMIAQTAIPLADPTHHHQYAFVFDADGDPDNNYEASPDFPDDFFQGTDLWYQAMYSPAAGWSLQAVSARGGEIAAVPSAARIVIDGDTMVALVPASELGDQECPEHRMTAFTHLGDWGMEDPHVWMGDAEPPVDLGLEGTCD